MDNANMAAVSSAARTTFGNTSFFFVLMTSLHLPEGLHMDLLSRGISVCVNMWISACLNVCIPPYEGLCEPPGPSWWWALHSFWISRVACSESPSAPLGPVFGWHAGRIQTLRLKQEAQIQSDFTEQECLPLCHPSFRAEEAGWSWSVRPTPAACFHGSAWAAHTEPPSSPQPVRCDWTALWAARPPAPTGPDRCLLKSKQNLS